MGRDALAALLLSAGEPSNLAVIDVRDSGKGFKAFIEMYKSN